MSLLNRDFSRNFSFREPDYRQRRAAFRRRAVLTIVVLTLAGYGFSQWLPLSGGPWSGDLAIANHKTPAPPTAATPTPAQAAGIPLPLPASKPLPGHDVPVSPAPEGADRQAAASGSNTAREQADDRSDNRAAPGGRTRIPLALPPAGAAVADTPVRPPGPVAATTPRSRTVRRNPVDKAVSLTASAPVATEGPVAAAAPATATAQATTTTARPAQPNPARPDPVPSRHWQTFRVKPGDSLARLFKRAGVSARQLDELMKSGKAVKKLRKIYPKDLIHLSLDQGRLDALRYDIDYQSYLLVERRDGKLVADIHQHRIDTRTTHASGTIESSLFLAAQKAGISQNLIMELAGIFGWDIDFALDIRKGDRFTVVYEERYRDGEKIADGHILTAEFTNRGKTYRAVRYTNPDTHVSEYYTPQGKSMRKAFLRTPVNFSRISSRFTLNRYHPVLHKFRSHKGVDYAAKRGTPIYASGDGKVIFKGRKGGYGRVIILQHGAKYTTLYAHLNSYNKKIRTGSRVKQGQTIAYVGSSGLATGPHLHYEFRVNGVHRNPLTVKLPESKPVPKRYLADFEAATAPLLAQLDALSRSQQLALADD